MHCIFPWMNSLMRALVLFLLLSFLPAFAAVSSVFGEAGSVFAQQPEPQQPTQTDEFVPISQLPAQDQLPAAPLLVTAYAFVWLVLFAYVVSVGRRLTKVQHEVERLESDIAKRA
jgi:CcmD family protein